MYLIKLKKKKAIQPCYANEVIVHSAEEIRNQTSHHNLTHFFMSLKQARELMFYFISRDIASKDDPWVDEGDRLEYISVVECSHYAPYREYNVIDYREFK